MAGCTLYTCSICNKRLFARNFIKSSIRDKTYICHECAESLKTHFYCNVCGKKLPKEAYNILNLESKKYICLECEVELNNSYRQQPSITTNPSILIDTHTNEYPNSLYIYQISDTQLEHFTIINNSKSEVIRTPIHQPHLVTFYSTLIDKQANLINAYSHIIIQVLSIQQLSQIKIDNGQVIYVLINELKIPNKIPQLATFQQQHKFLIYKLKV